MVETDTKTPRRGPRGVDWIAVHDRWSEGRSAGWIAERFGLTTRYVSNRCSWIDNHFPPFAPVRFKAGLARRLEDAFSALERGEPVEAERRAKALLTILRAAKAVEEWTMTMDDAAQPAEATPEAKAEDDPRAELERRLGNLLDAELERRAAGGEEVEPRRDARPVDGASTVD